MDREGVKVAALVAYNIGSLLTFVYLTLFNGYVYTWWNWIVALPVNMLLGSIWPIFWAILRPLGLG